MYPQSDADFPARALGFYMHAGVVHYFQGGSLLPQTLTPIKPLKLPRGTFQLGRTFHENAFVAYFSGILKPQVFCILEGHVTSVEVRSDVIWYLQNPISCWGGLVNGRPRREFVPEVLVDTDAWRILLEAPEILDLDLLEPYERQAIETLGKTIHQMIAYLEGRCPTAPSITYLEAQQRVAVLVNKYSGCLPS